MDSKVLYAADANYALEQALNIVPSDADEVRLRRTGEYVDSADGWRVSWE